MVGRGFDSVSAASELASLMMLGAAAGGSGCGVAAGCGPFLRPGLTGPVVSAAVGCATSWGGASVGSDCSSAGSSASLSRSSGSSRSLSAAVASLAARVKIPRASGT